VTDPHDVLPLAFFQREVLVVARDLLGRVLVSHAGGVTTRFWLTETEAYHQDERGAHTYGGKRTRRTEVMFHHGGKAYVYFVYGFHWQFNVVTGQQETGQAVLVRGGVPSAESRAIVRARRGWLAEPSAATVPEADPSTAQHRRKQPTQPPANVRRWCDGPAKLCQAAAITGELNGILFLPDQPVFFEHGWPVADADVVALPRVGIDYAGADALLPWRFRVLDGTAVPDGF
jgi:DNA-3-methyladenine glycosylase